MVWSLVENPGNTATMVKIGVALFLGFSFLFQGTGGIQTYQTNVKIARDLINTFSNVYTRNSYIEIPTTKIVIAVLE